MASAFSREKIESKMPQSKKVPRNETYKESLLRRIASGDPSSAVVAQSPTASKSSSSTTRSANTSTTAASKGSKEISPANNLTLALKRDAANNSSTAANPPRTELKFSKILSIALLIGPDKSPFKLHANKRNISKNPNLDDPVDLTTPTRRKPSSVRTPSPRRSSRRRRAPKFYIYGLTDPN